MSLPEASIIELDNTESTNNYAMQLIDGNTAQHGMTITARSQTHGKGQRGRVWADEPGNSLLMSVIVQPVHSLSQQFLFNAAISVAIAKVLQNIAAEMPVYIKWPNDLILNDKKAGGILIENVLRGANWSYSVIGIGINVLQLHFPPELPHATSLLAATGNICDIPHLARQIRAAIIRAVSTTANDAAALAEYNAMLYRRGQQQLFIRDETELYANIVGALPDGTLQVQHADGALQAIQHGQMVWVY